jgi:hypothetical protein
VQNSSVTSDDVNRAKKNWLDWQHAFEFTGDKASNPVLADKDCFNKFVKEYHVGRTIRKGTREAFRQRIQHEISSFQPGTGAAIDALDQKLRKEFGTCGGARGQRSLLSKIAAFLAPETFIAWDKYACRGLCIVLDKTIDRPSNSYQKYLEKLNTVLEGPIGRQICIAIDDSYPSQFAARNNRFIHRVLDTYLMRVGGRGFG